MIELPLSWLRHNGDKTQIKTIPLYFEKGNWLSLGMVPIKFDIVDYLTKYISGQSGSVLIRGLNYTISRILKNKGFEILPFGKEAILSFENDHFANKSLREIIRRGFRAGTVEEIPYSANIEKRLLKFREETVHGSEPLLQNLYVTGLPKDTRLFVFKNSDDNWLGAIVVSINSEDKFQTEFLLRKKSAPAGIMESLIFDIFNRLKSQNKKYWSLGEVPFVINPNEHQLLSKSYIYNHVGQSFRFAYNYAGLYFFKNKFSPDWETVYIAGYPRVTMRQLFTVSVKSNLLKLVIFRLLHPRRSK